MHTLYIIGNGFDLAHNLPTSYYNFAKFCASKYPNLYSQINLCLSNLNESWSNFENALGIQNYNILKQDIERNSVIKRDYPIGIDDSELDYAFHEWIVLINENLKNNIGLNQILPISYFSKEASFLNFNYTLTLEKLYNISQTTINYIHVREGLDDYLQKDKKIFHKLIYGHSLNKEEIEKQHVQEKDGFAKQSYVDTVQSFQKPYQIDELKAWMNNLPFISQIIVLGHSMDKVDEPYFQEIISKYPTASWDISCHINGDNWDDYNNKKQRCQELNIKIFTLFKF